MGLDAHGYVKSVSILGQPFTVSGTPTYQDWVITPPAGP